MARLTSLSIMEEHDNTDLGFKNKKCPGPAREFLF
jgi:hypothetical protein